MRPRRHIGQSTVGEWSDGWGRADFTTTECMTCSRSLSFALVGVMTACAQRGPLDSDDLRSVDGELYYVVGGDGHDHDEAKGQLRRWVFATGRSEAVTDRPAFVYGQDPTGTRLALTMDDEVVLARRDGRAAVVVASSPGVDWYPRWSPDGRSVLFESDRASFRDLYRYDVGSGAIERLTNDPEGNFDGVWSPDGRRIAFASSRAGGLDLWVMDADGKNPRRLTRHPGDSVKPAWSADGERIAFISARDGQDDLFVIAPDGEGIVNLTGATKGAHVQRFAWHPRARRLVYELRVLGQRSQIWTVDADTRVAARLSDGAHDDREPTWSPTGAYVAFASGPSDDTEIHVMRADGTRRTPVTRHEGRAWLPRWLPGTEGSTK